MDTEKILFVNLLWSEFTSRIEMDWESKYKKYGDFSSFNELPERMRFARTIKSEIEKHFVEQKIPNVTVLSEDSFYRILDKNRLSAKSDDATLNMFAWYLGYRGWNDFKRKKQIEESPKITTDYQTAFSSLNEQKKQVPHNEAMQQYSNEEGLIILAKRLDNARLILNTRIVGRNVKKPVYTKRAEEWNDAIHKYVSNGRFFKEVINGIWIEEAQKLSKIGNNYRARKINVDIHSILNIAIIEFQDGSQEAWFGWIISSYKGLEQPCFCSQDTKLIAFFRAWWNDLFQSGDEVE